MKNLLFVYSIVFALTLFSMIGCSSIKPGCIAEEKIVDVGTSGFVVGLECDEPDAVRADVKAWVDSIGLCKEVKQTGPIADVVCPIAAKALVEKLGSLPPAHWKCKATNAKAKAQMLIETSCKLIPVKE